MPLQRYTAKMARLDALERRYVPKVRGAIIRGCEAAADAVEAGASPLVAAALVKNSFLVAALEDLYERCGLVEAKEEYDYLTTRYPQKALPGTALVASWAGRLRRFISTEGATSIRAISETVRKKVRAVLTEAAELGLSVPHAARMLREEVATFSQQEAVTIVRTELITAANVGSLLGAQATGLRLQKLWLATPGSRTRPSHQAANGQAVALDGFFTVGQSQGRYPGDPLLPAGERIRCRCTQTYKPLE